MDRLFLDANVLFSAAYRADSGLLRLWKLRDVELCSSRYALEEARFNLADEAQRKRLTGLSEALRFYEADDQKWVPDVSLPEKDVPILLAAIEAQADYLLTGDICHFGPHFGKTIGHVEIALPGHYLRARQRQRKS
jgi:predicted nucleic acid-binding protein